MCIANHKNTMGSKKRAAAVDTSPSSGAGLLAAEDAALAAAARGTGNHKKHKRAAPSDAPASAAVNGAAPAPLGQAGQVVTRQF